jgi:hypothetical protein
MPIPMSVYVDFFTWVKYGHHIHPPNLSLTSQNKVGLDGTFCGCLIKFFRTDLDGNLSFTLNSNTASKLDHYLLTFFWGVSETSDKGSSFDQHMMNEKSKINSSPI